MAGRITPAAGRYRGQDAADRREERRARFREAGLQTFGTEPGYRGTRLGDLCKAAGLSSRQFYEEYRTMEDLLADLHLYVNDAAAKAVAEELPQVQNLTLVELMSPLLHAYVRGACADLRQARIAYVEVVGVSPRIDRQRLERRAVWVEMLNQFAADAVARGEMPPGNYRIAAAAIIGAINGLMHDWVLGWVNATVDEIAEELVQMVRGRYQIIGR